MLYSQKLRHLASWIEDHPEIEEELSGDWDYPTASIWVGQEDTAKFGRLCRALGEFEKEGYNGTLTARVRPTVDDQRVFSMSVYHTGACEKVAKLDEDGEPVVTRQMVKKVVETTTVEVEEEVEEFEWHCPESFLSL